MYMFVRSSLPPSAIRADLATADLRNPQDAREPATERMKEVHSTVIDAAHNPRRAASVALNIPQNLFLVSFSTRLVFISPSSSSPARVTVFSSSRPQVSSSLCYPCMTHAHFRVPISFGICIFFRKATLINLFAVVSHRNGLPATFLGSSAEYSTAGWFRAPPPCSLVM